MSTVTVFNVAKERLTKDFEEIFREHYLLVYRKAYSVTGRSQDAEDVLQNVFLWLLRRGIPSGLKDPKAYLYRAAVNASLNVVRSQRRERLSDDTALSTLSAEAGVTKGETDVQRRLVDALAQLHPGAVEMLIPEVTGVPPEPSGADGLCGNSEATRIETRSNQGAPHLLLHRARRASDAKLVVRSHDIPLRSDTLPVVRFRGTSAA